MNRFSGADVNEHLELFKADINLPKFKQMPHIQKIIDGLTSFAKLDPQTITSYAVDLSLYSCYLLQEENRLVATLNWCDSNIRSIIGKEAENYSGVSWYKEKEDIIIATNKVASELDKLRCITKVKLDTIKYLSQKIQGLADSLKKYSYEVKRGYDESYREN